MQPLYQSFIQLIQTNIQSNNIYFDFNQERFDSIIFLYPQCMNSWKLLLDGNYDEYHYINALLIEQLNNWITNSMNIYFFMQWLFWFDINIKSFNIKLLEPYLARTENGLCFKPGQS